MNDIGRILLVTKVKALDRARMIAAERALVERFHALGLTPDLPETKTLH